MEGLREHDAPRAPASRPAAQPPAAPFSASSFWRRFATYESVNANVAPIATTRRNPRRGGEQRKASVSDGRHLPRPTGRRLTEEPNRAPAAREDAHCAPVVVLERILYRRDEDADATALQADECSILHGWSSLVYGA